jgi:hypothetical protein
LAAEICRYRRENALDALGLALKTLVALRNVLADFNNNKVASIGPGKCFHQYRIKIGSIVEMF